MPRLSTADIEVATARGPGAGRFLAAALLDALDAGARLLAIDEAPALPRPARSGIDFRFAGDGHDTDELIRVGLGEDSRVVTAQLLRCAKRPDEDGSCDPGSLIEALRGGHSVSAVRWLPREGAPRTVELVIGSDREISVALTRG